jgi:hypothetical protein
MSDGCDKFDRFSKKVGTSKSNKTIKQVALDALTGYDWDT